MPEAAEIMVREAKSFKEAITQLGVPLTTAEAENVSRRSTFRKLLARARDRFYLEVGSNPGLTKDKVSGQMQALADKLEAEGESDKAAEVLFKLSKLKGWIGEAGNVNVFAGLTQKDIDEMRAKLNGEGLSTEGTSETQPN